MADDRVPKSKDSADETSRRQNEARDKAATRMFEDAYSRDDSGSRRFLAVLDDGQRSREKANNDVGERSRENVTHDRSPHGAQIERVDGKLKSVTDGKNTYEVEYKDGQISSIKQKTEYGEQTLQAGKDFKLGEATEGKDGSVVIKSADGKRSVTFTDDFSVTTREIGKKGDGSDDRLLNVHTKEGGDRSFYYDPKTNKLSAIVDRVHTNSGTDLVEVTRRLGDSETWAYESNFGKKGMRSNVQVSENGDFTSTELKRSRANDLVHKDNKDEMHQDLATARKHLAKVAASHGVFGGSESKCEAWQHKMEQRYRDLAHAGRRAPTDAQMMKTYEYLEKILTGGSRNIGSTSKRMLVESALKEYADPTHYINQGSHPSCCLAATERHVVETHPDDHARVLYEAITNKTVRSKLADSSGRHRLLRLSDQQIHLDNEAMASARGGWNASWSYSNKVFQVAAIKLAYPGYNGNGHGFPGASEDQARHVNRFVDGERTIPLVNRWYGGKPSFDQIQKALKGGTLLYFVPGHAMAIDKAAVKDGVAYVHVDNWWGGQGDGWRPYGRV